MGAGWCQFFSSCMIRTFKSKGGNGIRATEWWEHGHSHDKVTKEPQREESSTWDRSQTETFCMCTLLCTLRMYSEHQQLWSQHHQSALSQVRGTWLCSFSSYSTVTFSNAQAHDVVISCWVYWSSHPVSVQALLGDFIQNKCSLLNKVRKNICSLSEPSVNCLLWRKQGYSTKDTRLTRSSFWQLYGKRPINQSLVSKPGELCLTQPGVQEWLLFTSSRLMPVKLLSFPQSWKDAVKVAVRVAHTTCSYAQPAQLQNPQERDLQVQPSYYHLLFCRQL